MQRIVILDLIQNPQGMCAAACVVIADLVRNPEGETNMDGNGWRGIVIPRGSGNLGGRERHSGLDPESTGRDTR